MYIALVIWLPFRNTVLVSVHGAETLLEKLRRVCYNPSEDDVAQNRHRFNGRVSAAGFSISRRLSYPDNYLPLIRGRVEKIPGGCLVHIRYNLFFSSRIILIFWTLLSLAAAVALFWRGQPLGAVPALLFGLGNYGVTMANFRRQLHLSEAELMKVLE
jgi:hypothetical protein